MKYEIIITTVSLTSEKCVEVSVGFWYKEFEEGFVFEAIEKIVDTESGEAYTKESFQDVYDFELLEESCIDEMQRNEFQPNYNWLTDLSIRNAVGAIL